MNNERLKEIFKSLNPSEKHGLSFGLFPAHLLEHGLTKDEAVKLIEMKEREEK